MKYSRVVLFLIASFPAVFMLFQVMVKPYYLYYTSHRSWQKITASVEKFEVYDKEIELDYFFINATDTIRGNELFFGAKSGYDKVFIDKLSEKFNTVSKVNIFFNPMNPAENVVVRRVQIKTIPIAMLFFLTWEFFVFMLVFGFNFTSKSDDQIAEKIIINIS